MATNYLALGLVSVLSMSILGYMVYHNVLLEEKLRRSFIYAICGISVAITAEMGTSYFTASSSFDRAMNVVFCTIGFSVSPFVPVLIATAFARHGSRLGMVLLIPAAINFILVSLSPFFDFVFAVSPANEYERGPLFFIFVVAYMSSFAYLVEETVRAIRRFREKGRIVLIWLLLLFLTGTLMQLVWPAVHSTWPSISILMVFYYAYYCELLETHDAVTNLYSRRSYERHLLSLEKKRKGAIVLLDADDFKSVNDLYGHQFGDKCLMTIGESIYTSFSKIGTCHRIGGDEFCILCECTDEKSLLDAEDAFKKSLDAFRKEDQRIPCVSFGHAVYDRQVHEKIEQAVAEADQKLFQYKKSRTAICRNFNS
jgi:diguanylate cyclase (GGDEF)-like protein